MSERRECSTHPTRNVRDAQFWGSIRRFARCTDGAAAVEFVIVLPILLLFLFGTITLASALYIHVNMENAAREAARRMAVAEATFNGTAIPCGAAIVGSAESYACTYLANWGGDFLITAQELCPAREVVVQITVDATQASLLDIFGIFNGGTLTARVVMRKEAEC